MRWMSFCRYHCRNGLGRKYFGTIAAVYTDRISYITVCIYPTALPYAACPGNLAAYLTYAIASVSNVSGMTNSSMIALKAGNES